MAKFEIDLDMKEPGRCYSCPMLIEDSWGRNRCTITYNVINSNDTAWVKPEDCPLKIMENT